MAPNLAASQHQLIGDMILSRSLKQTEMATAAGCSERAIRRRASNLRLFGKTKAPWNGAERRRIITPQMLDALRERLLEKPGLYRDEMAVFLYDEFGILVTVSSISKALASTGWSKKATRHVAKGTQCRPPRFLPTQLIWFSFIPPRLRRRVGVR